MKVPHVGVLAKHTGLYRSVMSVYRRENLSSPVCRPHLLVQVLHPSIWIGTQPISLFDNYEAYNRSLYVAHSNTFTLATHPA
jgi:hypothetical protein